MKTIFQSESKKTRTKIVLRTRHKKASQVTFKIYILFQYYYLSLMNTFDRPNDVTALLIVISSSDCYFGKMQKIIEIGPRLHSEA